MLHSRSTQQIQTHTILLIVRKHSAWINIQRREIYWVRYRKIPLQKVMCVCWFTSRTPETQTVIWKWTQGIYVTKVRMSNYKCNVNTWRGVNLYTIRSQFCLWSNARWWIQKLNTNSLKTLFIQLMFYGFYFKCWKGGSLLNFRGNFNE